MGKISLTLFTMQSILGLSCKALNNWAKTILRFVFELISIYDFMRNFGTLYTIEK